MGGGLGYWVEQLLGLIRVHMLVELHAPLELEVKVCALRSPSEKNGIQQKIRKTCKSLPFIVEWSKYGSAGLLREGD